MGPKDFSQVWRWVRPGLCLVVILIWVGVLPLPAVAQEGFIYQPTQRLGQATSATLENAATKVQAADKAAPSEGSSYTYSRPPGKIIESPGPAASRDNLRRDQRPSRHYCFEFRADGLPKGSDPTEAYWFETRDGQLMLVDPLVTQRYSRMPR